MSNNAIKKITIKYLADYVNVTGELLAQLGFKPMVGCSKTFHPPSCEGLTIYRIEYRPTHIGPKDEKSHYVFRAVLTYGACTNAGPTPYIRDLHSLGDVNRFHIGMGGEDLLK